MASIGARTGLRAGCAAFLSFAALAVAVPTHATPEAAASREQSIPEVQRQITKLEHRMELFSERMNRTQVQLDAARKGLRKARAQIEAAELDVKGAQARVDLLAVELYRSGSVNQSLEALTAEDPVSFLQQAVEMGALSDSQAAVLEGHRAALARLNRLRDSAARREAAADELHSAIVVQRGRISAAIHRQQRILDDLELQERLRLEAAERAARDAQLAAAGVALGGLPSSAATGADIPADEKGQQAVRFALAQVGKAYVWGAEGPNAFDCSGLTMMAWRSAGVRFDHFSGLQYAQTRHVDATSLKPGDLLFFYHVNQHVGMYAGNGKIVHAANSRRGVVMDDLDGYYRSKLVAVSRPAG